MSRAIARVGERLGNRSGSPACLSQFLDYLADLRIGTQITQLANRSNHDTLGEPSANPLDTHLHTLAAALHVHPNTLDYRLRRIVELTGLDPSTTRGLQLLGAALASRRLGSVVQKDR